MKRVSLRVVTGLVLTTALLTALIAYLAWAATPSSNIWVSPGIYPGAPDYTVWREGANYFAKDKHGYQAYSGGVWPSIMQSMINALPNGGHIHLTTGNFLTGGLEINVTKPGIEITGEGIRTQVIVNMGATTTPFVVKAGNFRLENFAINASIAKTEGAAIACEEAVEYEPGTSPAERKATISLIRRVWIENHYEGLRFQNGTTMVRIEDVEIRNSYLQGVHVTNASFLYFNGVMVDNWKRSYNYSFRISNGYSIYVKHSDFLRASVYGVWSEPAAGVTNSIMWFENTAAECNSTGDGFFFTDNSGGLNMKIYFVNCWAVNCDNGMVLDGVQGIEVVGCQIHGNDEHGVWLQDTSTCNVLISGNQIDVNSRGTNDTYDGVHVDAGVGNFSIVANSFYGGLIYGETTTFQRYAVRVDTGTSDWYTIATNTCVNNGTGGIDDNGTGTNKTVADNTA